MIDKCNMFFIIFYIVTQTETKEVIKMFWT